MDKGIHEVQKNALEDGLLLRLALHMALLILVARHGERIEGKLVGRHGVERLVSDGFALSIASIHSEPIFLPQLQANLAIYEVVCDMNHACNFDSALPRCEILFFSDFSISAYLFSSTSACHRA